MTTHNETILAGTGGPVGWGRTRAEEAFDQLFGEYNRGDVITAWHYGATG
jgi:hypothetical protein